MRSLLTYIVCKIRFLITFFFIFCFRSRSRDRYRRRSRSRSPVRDRYGRDTRSRSSRSPGRGHRRSRSRSRERRDRDSRSPAHKRMLKEYSDRKGGRGDDTIKGTDLDSWKKETVEGMFYLVKPSVSCSKTFFFKVLTPCFCFVV